jgi:hypothetical protein
LIAGGMGGDRRSWPIAFKSLRGRSGRPPRCTAALTMAEAASLSPVWKRCSK